MSHLSKILLSGMPIGMKGIKIWLAKPSVHEKTIYLWFFTSFILLFVMDEKYPTENLYI